MLRVVTAQRDELLADRAISLGLAPAVLRMGYNTFHLVTRW